MPTILLTNYYSEAPLQIIRECLPAGFDLIPLDRPGKKAILERAPVADYLLVGGRVRIDRDVLDAAGRLKLIQRTGVGLDSIDLEAARERGLPIQVNEGVNARSVAEHTLLLILAVLRKLVVADASVRAGHWLKHDLGIQCHDLSGKTVGLLGMGNIGRIVAEMLKPFRVRLLYTDPNRLSAIMEQSLEVERRSLPELIRMADILSLHCPLTTETRGLIGATEIDSMKYGVVVINTARGELINQSALVAGLRSGKVMGAGLDAFPSEPIPIDSPLLKLTNVVLTPHSGALSRGTFRSMMSAAFAGITRFVATKLVDRSNV